jgi:arabinoxylan arabinofuranohydrolase
MRLLLFVLSVVFFGLGAGLSYGESSSFVSGQEPGNGNPILPGYYADPSVVQHDGNYYLYATLDPWGGETLGCWSSEDFTNWTFHELNWPTKTLCTSATSKEAMVWAPSVVKGVDGKFYMYVSVGSEIWVGSSEHPLGPWRNLLKDKPLIPEDFKPGYHMIDAEAFIDDDGQAWLYWGSGWNWVNGKCWVVPLNADMITFSGEVSDATPSHYFEAPFMMKRSGIYYLMYSDGKTTEDTYQVHYAMGESPRGPFKEAVNSPILVSDHEHNILSPGHHTVTTVNGESYILYHRHSIPFDADAICRQVCMDKLEWDEHGLIKTVKPTHRGLQTAESISNQLTPISVSHWTATSELSENYQAAFVGDQNYATLWKPRSDDLSPGVTVDFGAVVLLGKQELRLEYAWKPYRFTVKYSNDGELWKVLEEYMDSPVHGSPIVISSSIPVRYLRLEFSPESATSAGLIEWRFFHQTHIVE